MKMKMKNKINLIVLLLGISLISRAQDIPIQVINSAGGGGTVTGGVQMYYNIGETVISTISSPLVTQGFLQPDLIGKFGLTATPMSSGSVSCVDAKDGYIIITASVSSAVPLPAGSVTYAYYWDPPTACPTGTNCASVNNLAPGTYSVMVVSQYSGTLTVNPLDTVLVPPITINDSQAPCMIEVFNGVTPNGDGNNDFFYIKNIDQFPKNTVDIYNRWGQQLTHIEGYDNADKKWRGTIGNGDNIAPTGTYFYVIDLGNGQALLKGWIELLKK
jgi:gliding motility-associated-like protein